MPQSIPEVFSGAGGRVDDFEGNARDAEGLGGLVLPVSLCDLLPHHHIKAPTRLVAENKACIVIIPVRVHVHRSTEVHSTELIKTCGGGEERGFHVSGLCAVKWSFKSLK